MSKVPVVVQYWYETERGWGVRPDGYSLHLSEADRVKYCAEYWASMPEFAPDEYSKEDGSPKVIDMSTESALYEKLVNSRNGIREYHGDPAK